MAFFHWNRYGKKSYIYTIQNAILSIQLFKIAFCIGDALRKHHHGSGGAVSILHFLKLEWALNIEYATSQGQKSKDDFGCVLIIEYHMGGETSNRNQLGYTSLVSCAIQQVYFLKYHKNIRCKSIGSGYNVGLKSTESDCNAKPNNILLVCQNFYFFVIFQKKL